MLVIVLLISLISLSLGSLSQSNDPTELRIWSCQRNGENTYYYDPAVISFYAQTATEIIIRSNLDPSAYVKTTSNSYALDSLRLGKSLSYTPSGGYAVVSGWTGPMSNNMWNSCGQTSDFVTSPYWSCNNGNGLHLRPDWCGWSTNVGTPGGLSIFLKRQLDAPVPIWRCYSDGVNVQLVPSTEGLTAIGKAANAITIYSTKNPSEYVKTATSSYAIASLTNGLTLSYTTSGGYAITGDWVGCPTKTPSSMMWNTCGSSQGFNSAPYWSCNNGGGLHLTQVTCGWTSSGGTIGGITIAVTPTKPAPYRLVRIWSCSGNGQNAADYDLATIQKLANFATGITIMSRTNVNEYVTTKSESSYALASLRAGKTISYTTSNGMAIVDDWVGSKLTQIWNSCGSASDFISSPYWSCNNGNGLHLTPNTCGWTSGGGTAGGIGVYLHFKAGFTASLQGTTLALLNSDEAFTTETTLKAPRSSNVALIAGVSVGAVVFVALVVVVVVLVVKKREAIPRGDDLVYNSL